MRVLRGSFSEWTPPAGGSALAVGVFDGVHLGHRRIIRRLQSEAGELQTGIVTFARHPEAVISGGSGPRLLTPPAHRLALLEALGIDMVAELDFDDRMRRMPPEDFVQSVLVDALGCRLIVVGGEFRFGHRGQGDVALLRRLGEGLGFSVVLIELVSDGVPISSTRIRERLAEGDLREAAAMLGRSFSVMGRVVAGEGRGRSIGVPTANLEVDPDQMLPRRGVYAVIIRVSGVDRPGVANLGIRPTFDETQLWLEVHLIDFSGDIYGEEVEVEFRSRIRDERKFGSVDELVRQIQSDVAEGRRLLSADQPTDAHGT